MIKPDELGIALSAVLFPDRNLKEFVKALKNKKHRIWLAGNGGSASTVSHFACDLSTLGYDVTCMVDNVSNLSRLTNDFGWDKVFLEQIEGRFKMHDVLIIASVHGGTLKGDGVWSSNLVVVCKRAKELGGTVLAFLGCDGGMIKTIADVAIVVPHESAYVIEGIHGVLTHLICSELKQ